jgi:hypothetical protein
LLAFDDAIQELIVRRDGMASEFITEAASSGECVIETSPKIVSPQLLLRKSRDLGMKQDRGNLMTSGFW